MIKNIINKLGIDIIRYDKNMFDEKYYIETKDFYINKLKSAAQEIIDLYKEYCFIDFPSGNSKRISLMSKLLGTCINESIYLIYYLHKSIHLNGDICEFGIAQGSTSALLANEIAGTDKNIWLFDSFQGLPRPHKNDLLKDDIFNLGDMNLYEGLMSYNQDNVIERLKQIDFDFKRVRIVPGFIEKTIKSDNLPQSVCFAYIDFDFYEPIIVTLNYLDRFLMNEGYIIIDDYDYFSTGVKTAVEEFLDGRENSYELMLPNKSAGHFCILRKNISRFE